MALLCNINTISLSCYLVDNMSLPLNDVCFFSWSDTSVSTFCRTCILPFIMLSVDVCTYDG